MREDVHVIVSCSFCAADRQETKDLMRRLATAGKHWVYVWLPPVPNVECVISKEICGQLEVQARALGARVVREDVEDVEAFWAGV